MMAEGEIRATLRGMLDTQLFAVLATTGERAPHVNIVSFAAADDLATVLFATPRQTRKFAYLTRSPEVSMFVDNRANRARDLQEVFGVEISGRAGEAARLPYECAEHYRELYLARFPDLEGFLASPGTALMVVAVRRYDIVHRFQDVVVWEPPQ